MDWKKVGAAVINKGAPLLGRLLLGPAGGMVGEMVASTIGTEPDPDKVMERLSADPQALAEVRKMEIESQVDLRRLAVEAEANRLSAETERIKAVNATMQAESKSEHWIQYSWRPAWGFVSAAAFLVVTIFVCFLGYKAIVGGKTEAMTMIPQAITSFALLFGIPGAILGVSAWHRGRQKRTEAGEILQGGGFLKGLLKRS